MPPENMRAALTANLDNPNMAIVRMVGEAADAMDLRAYLIGGVVRDIMLGVRAVDLDIAVGGEVERLIKRLAAKHNAKIELKSRFHTWILRLGGIKLDIAAIRTERYPAPGALPIVQRSDLAHDLMRRDFSINSMALSINARDFGDVTDALGGARDISEGLLRVNHAKSFQDDPTRAMRAARYIGRFGFKLEERTAKLLARDVRLLREMNSSRIINELNEWLAEERCAQVTEAGQQLGILTAIHPDFSISPKALDALRRNQAEMSPLQRFALWAAGLPDCGGTPLSKRLAPSRDWRAVLEGRHKYAAAAPLLRGRHATPSSLHSRLKRIRPEVLQAISSIEEPAAKLNLEMYMARLNIAKAELNGNELEALGLAGRAIGSCLRAITRERLDGRIASREEEMEFARRFAQAN